MTNVVHGEDLRMLVEYVSLSLHVGLPKMYSDIV
jgi:hypothetical protein